MLLLNELIEIFYVLVYQVEWKWVTLPCGLYLVNMVHDISHNLLSIMIDMLVFQISIINLLS